MKNNKGFTLVELIIVIAIIAVLASSSFAYFSLNSSTNAKEVASDLQAMISRLKISTISGEINPYMSVIHESDGLYAVLYIEDENGIQIEAEKKKLANSGMEILYKVKESNNEIVLGESSPINLKFDRDSAAFDFSDKVEEGGSVLMTFADIEYIRIEAGAYDYILQLTQSTGFTEIFKG